MRGLLGIAVILFLAWAISEERGRVPWRLVIAGILLQFGLALLFLKFPPARVAFLLLNRAVEGLQSATEASTRFCVRLSRRRSITVCRDPTWGELYFCVSRLALGARDQRARHPVVLLGHLAAHRGGFRLDVRISVGVGGPLGLGAAVHIFVGHMGEAPLLIRPYLMRLARGELFALMSCGMAGIAGTVMVLYASLVGAVIPNALGNILIAAVISTPAALAIAALMVPFQPDPSAAAELSIDDPPVSAMDAIAKGTRDGVGFLLNIVAMLIVTITLVSLVDAGLGLLPNLAGAPVTLPRLFAYAFRPIMWLIGIPGPETRDGRRH